MSGWIAPMLIGAQQPAFDDPDFIFELKLDGIRCIVCKNEGKTQLYNKRGHLLSQHFPELDKIGERIKKDCVLDGELYVFREGITDFFAIQKRVTLSDPFRIDMLSQEQPATFTAFDILNSEGQDLTAMPLMARKQILNEHIAEDERINVSRFVQEHGVHLFALTKETKLEGIVTKRCGSRYHPGRRSKDWIKCKNLMDDDFVIVGMIPKDNGMTSLILAQYDEDGKLIYRGHVTLGVPAWLSERGAKAARCPFSALPPGNESAVWFDPPLVGTVRFMHYTRSGQMRQPVFKGLREDKLPWECVIPSEK